MIYAYDRPLSDPCKNRHWSASSETFTGADSLITAVKRDYIIIACEPQSHACKTQTVTVYVFTLEKDGEKLTMPVIANPYADQIAQRFKEVMQEEAELIGV